MRLVALSRLVVHGETDLRVFNDHSAEPDRYGCCILASTATRPRRITLLVGTVHTDA